MKRHGPVGHRLHVPKACTRTRSRMRARARRGGVPLPRSDGGSIESAWRRRRRLLARSVARTWCGVGDGGRVAVGYTEHHARHARRASRGRTRTSSPLRARHHRLPFPPRTTSTRALRRRRRSLDRSIARTRCGVTQARSAPPILHFRSFFDRSWSQEQQPHASAFRYCPPQATPTLPRLSVCLHICMCYYCLFERSLPSPPPLQVRVRGARRPVS